MVNVVSRKSQKGFIGTLMFLFFLIGILVVVFAGRVTYNHFKDQNEIFSFNAFDYTFRMTQEKSLKAKIKDSIDKAVDGTTSGIKEGKKAVDEVLEERGVKDAVKDVEKKAKEGANEVSETVEVTIDGVKQKISKEEAENISKQVMGLMGDVFNGVSKSIDNLKKE